MKRQTLLRRLLIAAGAIVVLVIVAFGPTRHSPTSQSNRRQPALATVADRSFPVLAIASGVLQPGNLENVNFTIAGQVQPIYAQVESKVTAHQVLATLNDSTSRRS